MDDRAAALAHALDGLTREGGENLALGAWVYVRFSRHAKNGARDIGATIADAEGVIANPIGVDIAPDGKRRYVGTIRGQRVRAVVAVDDPDLIVTIHRRRR
jgi:hypothetical protein